MIAFRVSLNGTRVCTAGIRDFGVLSAIVTWVRRRPEHGRDGGTIEEHLTVEVGGFTSTSRHHSQWLRRRLRVGDRVSIDVVDAAKADRPKHRYRDDPRALERAKRRYLERLKNELEGAVDAGNRRRTRASRRASSR
jgi:hypothetical protein